MHLQVASAMDLPFADAEIDLVVIGNAILMMSGLHGRGRPRGASGRAVRVQQRLLRGHIRRRHPVEIASLCMQQGIARAFTNLGISEVARNWLEIIAVRR